MTKENERSYAPLVSDVAIQIEELVLGMLEDLLNDPALTERDRKTVEELWWEYKKQLEESGYRETMH